MILLNNILFSSLLSPVEKDINFKNLYECDRIRDQFYNIKCFHGFVTRGEAEKLLKNKKDGSFIVRINSKDVYIISVVYGNQVLHYPILSYEGNFQLYHAQKANDRWFNGLDELISYHKSHVTSLPCKLDAFVKGHLLPYNTLYKNINHLIHIMIFRGEYVETKEIFIKMLAHHSLFEILNMKNVNGWTVFHICIIANNTLFLQHLLTTMFNNQSMQNAMNLYQLSCTLQNRDLQGQNLIKLIINHKRLQCLEIITKSIDGCPQESYRLHMKSLMHSLIMKPDLIHNGDTILHYFICDDTFDILSHLLSNYEYPMLCLIMKMKNTEEHYADNLAINEITDKNRQKVFTILQNHKSKYMQRLKEISVTTIKLDISREVDPFFAYALNRQEIEFVFGRLVNNQTLKENYTFDGTFCIRYDEIKNPPVEKLTISILYEENIFHFNIFAKNNAYRFIDEGPEFLDLNGLINYYSSHSDGLPCKLNQCVVISPFDELRKKSIDNFSFLSSNDYTPHLQIPTISLKCKRYQQNQIKLIEEIGRGEYGAVFKGELCYDLNDKINWIPVAIKTLHPEYYPNNRDEFLREVDVMMELNHPNIVQLIGICPTQKSILIVQELASLGSLWTYIIEMADLLIPHRDFYNWALCIAKGMAYLTEKHFVHRDLATRNILVFDRNTQVKISDFGLSRLVAPEATYYKSTKGGKWPIKWYAPESINFGKFSHASDVWSFGVTIWEIFSYSAQPFDDLAGLEVLNAIENGERLPKPYMCTSELYALLLKCWAYDSQERPTFSHLTTWFRDKIKVSNK